MTDKTQSAPKKSPTSKRVRNGTSAADKWGAKVIALGFCMLPSLLLRAQRRLKLSPTQLAVLIQLADFWWDAGRKPFPKKADLAERLGLSDRQVQRYIAELEEEGFLKRIERRATHRGKISNEYDLQGLVDKLAAHSRVVGTRDARCRAHDHGDPATHHDSATTTQSPSTRRASPPSRCSSGAALGKKWR